MAMFSPGSSLKRPSLQNILLLFIVLISLIGCSRPQNREGTPSAVPLNALKLSPSADCDDLKRYVEEVLIERYTSREPLICTDCPLSGLPFEEEGDGVATTAGGSAAFPDAVTRTNTQEEGVDEADRVEVDGEGRLYVVNGGFLVIEQGFPPQELRELSRLNLDVDAYGLYLDEARRRVVVFARRWIPIDIQPVEDTLTLPVSFVSYDELIFVDVADPAQPRITERLRAEGFQIDNRRIGKRIHLVSRFRAPEPEALVKDESFLDLVNRYREIVGNETGTAEEIERLKGEIRLAIQKSIAETEIQSLLPRAFRTLGETETAVDLLSCNDVLLPEVKEELGLLIVTSVDTDGANLAATALINNAWQIYASKEHLYVTQSSNGWWWSPDQPSQTALYKFRISDEKPVYLATGSIDGRLTSRFNLSEHEGFLRVAATEDRLNSETNQLEQKNHLFILEDDQAGELKVVGSVLGFAPGESITGTRFLGDRGFVVTFRQVDPLFAFDLSDPRQPKLMGELTLPGFSTYLHPLDETHLLTIGLDAGKVQLQVFDVTDLTRPTLLHKYSPAGGGEFGWSEATFDPHAFTFYAPRNLLAIPWVTWDFSTGASFSGIAAFRVSIDEGFTELGRVDHSDLAFQVYCTDIPPDQSWIAEQCKTGVFLGGAAPTRSVIMTSGPDTFLYSLSNIGIKTTPIDQPQNILGSLILPNPGYGWWSEPVVSNRFSF